MLKQIRAAIIGATIITGWAFAPANAADSAKCNLLWANASSIGTIVSLREFVAVCPNHSKVAKASQRIATLRAKSQAQKPVTPPTRTPSQANSSKVHLRIAGKTPRSGDCGIWADFDDNSRIYIYEYVEQSGQKKTAYHLYGPVAELARRNKNSRLGLNKSRDFYNHELIFEDIAHFNSEMIGSQFDEIFVDVFNTSGRLWRGKLDYYMLQLRLMRTCGVLKT